MQHAAVKSSARGRLAQLHLSLMNYESAHGRLPSRHSLDSSGEPAFSWLALVLPFWEQPSVLDQLDTTKSWNAPENAQAVNLGETFWDWYRQDGFFACALKGDHSIWADDGEPRGDSTELANSIALISVNVGDVHPLQPFFVTEDQLEAILADGGEALFIAADRASGEVHLKGGKLVFERQH